MKKIIPFLLLFPCLLIGQASNPARRLNNPIQYPFGYFTQIPPFTHPNGYTSISDTAQIQPTALVSNTESFASTSDFTTTLSAQTFSVASNVGTVAASGVSTGYYFVNGTATLTAPDIMDRVTISQNGAAATSNTIGVGVCGPSSGPTTRILAQVDALNSKIQIDVFTGGTDTVIGQTAFTVPSAPWQLALQVSETAATVWVYSNNVWTVAVAGTDISATFNPSTDGNLSGFGSCLYVATGAATTTSWQFSNFVSGAWGATELVNLALVKYPDGRPYINNGNVYFTAEMGASENGILAYNFASNYVSIISKIWVDSGTSINWFGQAHILYDPGNSEYRLTLDGWQSSGGTNVPVYYGTVPLTSNLLSSGVHVISQTSLTQITGTTSIYGFDHDLVCSEWNPSASSCSKWLLAYNPQSGTLCRVLDSTTADPSTNPTWTNVGTVSLASCTTQGSQLQRTRTANGSAGISYYQAMEYAPSNSVEAPSLVYNTSPSYAALGQMNFDNLGVNQRPLLFSYGDRAYVIVLDSNNFTSGNCCGMPNIASGPENVAAPSMAQTTYVANTGATSVASITSSAVTISAGCYAVFAHAGGSGAGSITVSSSPAASWTTISSSYASDWQVIAIANLAAGSTTFTSTPSTSEPYQSMIVMQIPSTTCTGDSTAAASQAFSSTGTISMTGLATSQPDLGLMCEHSSPISTSAVADIDAFSVAYFAENAVTYGGTSNKSDLMCFARPILSVVTGDSAHAYMFDTVSGMALFAGIKFNDYAPNALPVSYSPPSGYPYQTGPFTLSSGTPGATICFTEDGTFPLANGAGGCSHGSVYSSPITLTGATNISAIAVKQGLNPSWRNGANYGSTFVVGNTGCSTASNVTSLACSYTPEYAGDRIVVGCTLPASHTGMSISSSPANTWTIREQTTGSPVVWTSDAVVSSTAALTITCSWSSASTYPGMQILELSGTTGYSSGSNGPATASSTSFTSNPFTTTARTFAIMTEGQNGGVTFGSGSIAGVSGTLYGASSGYYPEMVTAVLPNAVTSQTGTISFSPATTSNGTVVTYTY